MSNITSCYRGISYLINIYLDSQESHITTKYDSLQINFIHSNQSGHINVNVVGIKLVAYNEHDYFGTVLKEFQILTWYDNKSKLIAYYLIQSFRYLILISQSTKTKSTFLQFGRKWIKVGSLRSNLVSSLMIF